MASAPTRDIGVLDAGLFGYLYNDLLEVIPDLMWPTSVQTYARMRHDPQLAAILAAYTLPIRRATWAVDPAGCRDEVAHVVADDLGLSILGADTTPGPARRRGVRWAEHLRLALLSLVYGFMPFERRYEIRDGQARLVNLGERMPHTVRAIDLHRDGTLKSISQEHAAGGPIPADRLLWYAHEREGAAWTGRSIMRASYGAWLLKHETWRVHATSIRRFGMGIPSVEAPPGATPAQVIEAGRLASAMRAGDTAGVGLPPGFRLNITGMTGSAPDAMAFIEYLDQQMSRSALAGLLDLGQTRNGSRALGDSMLELFFLSLQAVADEIADTATRGASVNIVDLNWGENEAAPRIVATDVGQRHEINADALQKLIDAGALTPDPALEAYVRGAWRLPARAQDDAPSGQSYAYDLDYGILTIDERRAQIGLAPLPDGQGAGLPAPANSRTPASLLAAPVQARRRTPKARARAVRAAGSEGAHRQLTLTEAASGMDPDAIQAVWQSALDQLLADWAGISQTWRDDLAEQIRDLVTAGNLAGLAALVLDPGAAIQLLGAAMMSVAERSAAQMVAEAASQGVDVDQPPVNESHLLALAHALGGLLASGLASAGAREAIRQATPDASGEAVAAAVVEHLEGLSDAWLREQLGGALSAAQSDGRFAVLDAAPEATYYASEVLDQNTCPKCVEIDGHEFADLAEAKATYAPGGYIDCDGRLRCRGIIATVWTEEG
ncbi:phage portal protein family protein [Streptosporangium canum]|uniref:phage portal protein family protein n=1 Tax=Streptosporangium canum TaxID=324952 RepID=UPI0033BAB3C2